MSPDVLHLLMHLHQSPDIPKFMLFWLIMGGAIPKDKVK